MTSNSSSKTRKDQKEKGKKRKEKVPLVATHPIPIKFIDILLGRQGTSLSPSLPHKHPTPCQKLPQYVSSPTNGIPCLINQRLIDTSVWGISGMCGPTYQLSRLDFCDDHMGCFFYSPSRRMTCPHDPPLSAPGWKGVVASSFHFLFCFFYLFIDGFFFQPIQYAGTSAPCYHSDMA